MPISDFPIPIPFAKYMETAENLNLFSTKEMEKKYQEYRNSIDLKDGFKSGNVFDDYLKDRIKDVDGFAAIKMPDGKKTLGDIISIESDKTTAIKNAVNKALAVDEKTKQARNNFKADLATANKLIKKDPPVANLSALGGYLQDRKAAVKTAVEAQHKLEIEKLEVLINDTAFKNNLRAATGEKTDSAIKKITDEALTTLKNSQKAELEKIEKTITDEVTNLHKSAQEQRDRIPYLGTMYDHPMSQAMRAEIDRVALLNKKEDSGLQVEVNVSPTGKTILKGVDVKHLQFLQTITGRHIRNNNGVMEMQLPPFYDIGYYYGRHDNISYDLTSLAAGMRACGYTKITMTVTHYNADTAQEMGRKAYEACLRAGFDHTDAANITINVNGEDVKLKELFKNDPARKQAAEEAAIQAKSEREKYIDDSYTPNDIKIFKDKVFAERQNGISLEKSEVEAGEVPRLA